MRFFFVVSVVSSQRKQFIMEHAYPRISKTWPFTHLISFRDVISECFQRDSNLNPIEYVEEMITRKITKSLFWVLQVSHCYLVKTSLISEFKWPEKYEQNAITLLEDAWFSSEMTKRNIRLKILNEKTYGQIVNILYFNHLNPNQKYLTLYPELGRFFENHDLWQKRYIDPDVIDTLAKGNEIVVYLGPKNSSILRWGISGNGVMMLKWST